MEQSLSFSTVALLPGSGKNHKESGTPDLYRIKCATTGISHIIPHINQQATIITHNLSQLSLGTLVQQEPV